MFFTLLVEPNLPLGKVRAGEEEGGEYQEKRDIQKCKEAQMRRFAPAGSGIRAECSQMLTLGTVQPRL